MSKIEDQQKLWTESLKKLPAEQAQFADNFISTFVTSFRAKFDDSLREMMPILMMDALRNVGYNEEIAGMVHLLAAGTDDSKEEILRKALTLYSLAINAREQGNRLSILSPDDVIVREVTGFEPIDCDAQTVVG